jgi:hypothetical protein
VEFRYKKAFETEIEVDFLLKNGKKRKYNASKSAFLG